MGTRKTAKSGGRASSRIGVAGARTFKSGLNAIAFQLGGKKIFFTFARMSEDEGIRKLVELWDTCPSKDAREHFDIEAAAVTAGVTAPEILANVLTFAQDYCRDHASLLAAISHPDVVAASIEAAKKPRGDRDRKFLFQHSQFIPTPGRGGMTKVQVNQLNQNNPPPLPAGSGELPPFHQTVVEMGRVQRGELLEAGDDE